MWGVGRWTVTALANAQPPYFLPPGYSNDSIFKIKNNEIPHGVVPQYLNSKLMYLSAGIPMHLCMPQYIGVVTKLQFLHRMYICIAF